MNILTNNKEKLCIVVSYDFIKQSDTTNWKASILDRYRKIKVRDGFELDSPLEEVSIGLEFWNEDSTAFVEVHYSFLGEDPFQTNPVFGGKMDWKVKDLLGWDFYKNQIYPVWEK